MLRECIRHGVATFLAREGQECSADGEQRGETVFRDRRQHTHDNRFQPRGTIGPVLHRRNDRASRNVVEHLKRILARVAPRAREQLVQDEAKGILVAPMVHFARAAGLLGRHVGGRAQDRHCPSQDRRPGVAHQL